MRKKYLTEEERKAAHRESQRKYAEANPDKVNESIRKYVEANPDKVNESKRKWREANPEMVKEIQRKWIEANPDKVNENQRKWRKNNSEMVRAIYLASNYKQNDKKYNRGESTITPQWIVDNIFTSKCFYCGETDWAELGCDRIDNDLPHTPENVVCCCEKCNKERHLTPFEEFLAKKKYV